MIKRIVCMLLALTVFIPLAACGKEKKAAPAYPVDIEYYANLGQIKECPYALGTAIDDIEAALLTEENEEEHDSPNGYFLYEKDGLTRITGEEKEYVYETDKRDNGISCIVDYAVAYEFNEASVNTVKNALTGKKFTEREADGSEFFFMPDTAQVSVLEYKFGKNTLAFLFYNDVLSVTVLYNNHFPME